MKTYINVPFLLAFFLWLSTSAFGQKQSKDKNSETTIENDLPVCTGIPREQRPTVSVSNFLITASRANSELGGELATMLSSALTNTQCFRVLRSANKLGDAKYEKELEQEGTTNETGTDTKMLSTQVLIEGEVTEYNLSNTSGGMFGVTIGGKQTAIIGMIITGYDPKTREQLFSKSFNKESKQGPGKIKIFGLDLAKTSIKSPAVADACEKAIIDIVKYIASKKSEFELPSANAANTVAAKVDYTNCNLLKQSYIPKIMVILPEFHIMRRIPDPAGETEINRKFIEAGFPVVDPIMFATLQNGTRFSEAAKDPAKAISLGREFGADIVIFGEAFSERSGTNGNMITCRARVEVRAVKTEDATMLATNGLEAGSQDLSEFVGAKAALRSAGTKVGDYMLQQLCSRPVNFSKTAAKPTVVPGKQTSITEINVENATELSKWKPLTELLLTKYKILEKSSSAGVAYIRLEHTGTVDDLADFIDTKLGSKFAVKDYGAGKLLVAVK